MNLLELQRTCDLCGEESTTLYEVDGYTGKHLECPRCFHGEAAADSD